MIRVKRNGHECDVKTGGEVKVVESIEVPQPTPEIKKKGRKKKNV